MPRCKCSRKRRQQGKRAIRSVIGNEIRQRVELVESPRSVGRKLIVLNAFDAGAESKAMDTDGMGHVVIDLPGIPAEQQGIGRTQPSRKRRQARYLNLSR